MTTGEIATAIALFDAGYQAGYTAGLAAADAHAQALATAAWEAVSWVPKHIQFRANTPNERIAKHERNAARLVTELYPEQYAAWTAANPQPTKPSGYAQPDPSDPPLDWRWGRALGPRTDEAVA